MKNEHAQARRRRRIPADAWVPADIAELEPAAWDALHYRGNSAVAAGPGAGKTEFLAQRAAFLLQTSTCPAPRRILAISYKRDSAVNLRRRVASRVPDDAHRFTSLTFDAFTKGMVDRFARSLPPAWRFGAEGYKISQWYEPAARDFLSALANSAPEHMRQELLSIPASRFLPDVVGAWPLPRETVPAPTSVNEYAAWSWWQEHYIVPETPAVDFMMLNRLADLIVRDNPRLLRALRATYPYVFVDEFQDTTAAQITFLHNVFGRAGVITTVVGDGKQRIMRFAGALEDAMARYQRDFAAKQFHLTWNFRSSADLVTAQHRVARQLEPAIAAAVSKAQAEDGHVPLAIWVYANAQRESEHVAEWIAADIAKSERRPSDFALVARQKVAVIEPAFARALGRYDISVRNDDTLYGKLRLQDLLKHDVTRLLLGTLRLAAQRVGLGSEWVETHALLCRITGVEHDELASRRTADQFSSFLSGLSVWLRANQPDSADPAELVRRAAGVVVDEQLAAHVRSMHTGDNLVLIQEALTARLAKVMASGSDWTKVLADVAASDAVTLMTIHRSKGLEYHTVVMLGLDDEQWWSYYKDTLEATSTFFVGLSRAAQRLVFTSTNAAGRQSRIRAFYELLDQAGAVETRWDEAI